MLMSVDLPAPFSPSRQRTSPGIARRLIRSLATTPGKVFVISMSSTAGAAPRAAEPVGVVSPASPTSRLAQCRGRPAQPAGEASAAGEPAVAGEAIAAGEASAIGDA